MARIRGNHLISGSYGDSTYSVRDGENFLQPKPKSRSKAQWLRNPKYGRAREAAIEFGGASKAAATIYRGIGFDLRKYCAPYTHNRIAGVVRAYGRDAQSCALRAQANGGAAKVHGKGHVGRRAADFRPGAYAQALVGMDLTDNGSVEPHPSKRLLRIGQCGDVLRVQGLRDMAAALQGSLRPGERLECQVFLRYITLPDLARDPHKGRGDVRNAYHDQTDGATAWLEGAYRPFYASHLPDVLELDLAPPSAPKAALGEDLIVVLVVEWQAMRGHRPRNLPFAATVKFVAAILPNVGRHRPAGMVGRGLESGYRLHGRVFQSPEAVRGLQALFRMPWYPPLLRRRLGMFFLT